MSEHPVIIRKEIIEQEPDADGWRRFTAEPRIVSDGTPGRGPRCPDCRGWLHLMAEDYMNSISIQAQCTRCEYTYDSASPEAVEWEYAQVATLREQGLKEPEWQPMKAGTGKVLTRHPRAPYAD